MKKKDDLSGGLSESTESQVRLLDKTLEEGIGTNRELIFDPEFWRIYFSNLPYLLIVFYVALWFLALLSPSAINILVLSLATGIALISVIFITFHQSKTILKLRILNRALELHRQNQESQGRK